MARSRRFAAPVLVAGLIGVGAAVPALASGSRPQLPKESARQLVTGILDNHTGSVSGRVAWRPDLGLPSLGGLTDAQGVPSSSGLDPTSLLSTTQTFRLWVDGRRERLATTGALAETDVVRHGNQVWVWDSAKQHVEHVTFRPGAAHPAGTVPAGTVPAGIDPQTLAARLIRHLEAAGTTVSVARPVDVAGVACQVLRLAPAHPAGSTVSAVDIAVDAANSTVLRVSVDAVGQAVPALQVGFQSVSFAAPPTSVFAPPRGRTTTNRVVTPGSLHRPTLPNTGWTGYAPLTGTTAAPASPPVRTLGHGWSTVLEVTPKGRSGTLAQLEAAATPVSGAWGSGRLLHSSLLDALMLPDGRVLVGFVPPAVLEADAAASAG